MQRIAVIGLFLLQSAALVGPAAAHFGMLIPSDNMVMADEGRTVTLRLSFSHPFEGIGMDLDKPESVRVTTRGKTADLAAALAPAKVMGHAAWSADYALKRPGVHTFCMIPQPYWEAAEDVFIIHYTKTVVAAFGDEDGWDEEIGLKTEIVPLSRPFGLYAGNLFQGIVILDGKPVPNAEVEVEYYNQTGEAAAPTGYMITQTVKADGNGVFSYSVPKAGWWGFAALNEADYRLKTPSGEEKPVELGAVIWVKFEPWQER